MPPKSFAEGKPTWLESDVTHPVIRGTLSKGYDYDEMMNNIVFEIIKYPIQTGRFVQRSINNI